MPLVHVATEDELSESLACKIVANYVPESEIALKLRKGGMGYLRSSLPKFCQMALREHVLLLTDLDDGQCAPTLIANWFGNLVIPPRLLFRVTVREIEAWLLADRPGLAQLFDISEASLPADPDELADPKQTLLNAAKRAPRNIRSDILRVRGSVSSQGLGYNRVLSTFVDQEWSAERARARSPSLHRTLNRLTQIPMD